MSELYKTGTAIVYDVYGVCEVKGVKRMSFSSFQEKEDYYILSPYNNPASTYYVPVSLHNKLRLPFEKSQIDELIEKAKSCEVVWSENRQTRSEEYRRILDRGICPELFALIKCLFERKSDLQQKGKSISETDKSVLTSAERYITEEFSFSLGIDKEEVTGYIKKRFED